MYLNVTGLSVKPIEIHTIGFTKASAREFFEKLKKAKIEQLIDVRLNNTSQLAAFAKKEDLVYFLNEICGIKYMHEPLLAPTQEMLDQYKKEKCGWETYQDRFLKLMNDRKVESVLTPEMFCKRSVLLCSEHEAKNCHRSLVVTYLQSHWKDVTAIHL